MDRAEAAAWLRYTTGIANLLPLSCAQLAKKLRRTQTQQRKRDHGGDLTHVAALHAWL
jgi:hypothetical protein